MSPPTFLDEVLMMIELLDSSFYSQPTVELAQSLLGKLLVHGETSGIIVETEAYCHNERACHTYKGMTNRNRILFDEPGKTYIFQVHSHTLFNLSAAPKGIGETVLIRAIEPVDGIELMKMRRNMKDLKQLTNGPGKLAQAMSIDQSYYGHDLRDQPLYIANGLDVHRMECGKRIGVDYAGEDAELPWRFWIHGNKFVSRKKVA